jgi:hypothetical protein
MSHHRFNWYRRALVSAAAVGLFLVSLTTTSAAAPVPQASLDAFTATVDRAGEARLKREGFDVTASRSGPNGVEVDLVLSNSERVRLERQGVSLQPKRNRDGKTVKQLAAEQGGRIQGLALL